MRSTRIAIIVLPVAAALLLSGCTGGDPEEQKPPAVTIDPVSVPDELLPTEATVALDNRMFPAVDDAPWLIGGSSAQPGAGAMPTVWTAPDGNGWTEQIVDADFEGSFTGDLAASDQLAALSGDAWTDGVTRAALWVSSDREDWKRVELPDGFANTYRVVDSSVVGETVIVIGEAPDGASRGIRVEGTEVTEFALPDVAKGDIVTPLHVIADEDHLVLVAAPGPEGETVDTSAFVSDDLGDSWSDAAPITSTPGFVSGIARAEDGFVATGGNARDESSNATGPAAWFSADGTSWAAETVPGPSDDGNLFYYGSADVWLGGPNAAAGGVTAVMANDNAALSGLYSRATGGAWSLFAETSVNPGSGVGGFGASADGATTSVVIGESGYARAGVSTGGAFTDSVVLAPREDIQSTSTLYAGSEDGVLVTLTRPSFTVDSDLGWRNSTEYRLGELDGTTLAQVPWDPSRAADLTNVRLGFEESGAQVLLGSFFDSNAATIAVEAWYRATADDEWTPATGFPTTGATYFYAVERIGDEWVAMGETRGTSAVGDAAHGVIWTSPDGATWTNSGGEFGEGSLESSVSDVCALPDGGAVAVGWIEESASQFSVATWTRADGAWVRNDIGELGSRSGSASSCAPGEDGVIMSAFVSGRDTLQLSSDGSAWDEVFRASRGISLGEPVAVPGGFAASGSLTNDSFSGPVVWLSADGSDWSPVSVPSERPGSTFDVAPYGDDLVVTMSGRTGQPVSIVRGIEKVIADNG